MLSPVETSLSTIPALTERERTGWRPVAARPDMGFLAHLLASHLDEPWQRACLRAEPVAAARRYTAIQRLG